ncbi:MAG: hypothetical protein Q8927_17140 [Bacteroidota bacterium]|nr:hypothetical protein [Bacteroidota bacterium]MDP4217931.1 hypothetical protein [Bacteroidota bacterium]MDP4252945.1 hypothetical protein [Bacteroidota bacterium]MDP4256972.1 hypothetical protein [Bacteroidota bacterium]
MKKHIELVKPLSMMLLLVLPAFGKATGDGDEVKKKKTINKSYTVTAEDKLDIDNSFGDVVVSTWDKNEITVDIEIGANASTDEKAQSILDKIQVKDSHDGHVISFKTKVEDKGDKWDKEDREEGRNRHRHGDNDGENKSFYINYTVHMPAVNPLNLMNSFGKIIVPDMRGEVTLISKFGGLEAGKLSKVNTIDVQFGKAKIGEVNDGKLVFKFDQGTEIGKVNGNVKISSEFSHNVKFNVSDEIKELGVFESYSNIRLVVTKQLSADFEVHTSFGSFHNNSDFGISEEKEGNDEYGPHFDKDFAGKAGDGRAKIRIKSSFGSVNLAHSWSSENDKPEGKDKDKSKHKHKDKDNDDDETSI